MTENEAETFSDLSDKKRDEYLEISQTIGRLFDSVQPHMACSLLAVHAAILIHMGALEGHKEGALKDFIEAVRINLTRLEIAMPIKRKRRKKA